MLLHHSLLHNSCYHYRVDIDALGYLENYVHSYNFKNTVFFDNVYKLNARHMCVQFCYCCFYSGSGPTPPPPTSRSHLSKGRGVILISQYPNDVGIPTKSGRRTAAKTQT
jgi:hypothetical protein